MHEILEQEPSCEVLEKSNTSTQTVVSEFRRQLLTKPDFIIAGAMKSGTTSLHSVLASHPRVFMPVGEVQLFTIDDIEQNPVFSVPIAGEWTYQNFDRYFDEYAAWHHSLYAGSAEGQLLGEDAPSYLPSKCAIDRISSYLPNTKLIIILRDPVSRLYSHYWHLVRTYRAFYSLEDTIRFQPGNLLQRSYYEEQVRYCFEKMPREQICVILFEEFVKQPQVIIERLFDFLGLESLEGVIEHSQHANKGSYPRYPGLMLIRNRIFRHMAGRGYRGSIPRIPAADPLPLATRVTLKALRIVNPQPTRRPKSMSEGTRLFLTRVLRERNAGLPDLLDRDLSEYWPTFRQLN